MRDPKVIQVVLGSSIVAGSPVSATVAHGWSGERVRITLLQFIQRASSSAAPTVPLSRLDIEGGFESSMSSAIMDINGYTTTYAADGVNGFAQVTSLGPPLVQVPLYMSPACFVFPAANPATFSLTAGDALFWEGYLRGPYITFTVRDLQKAPSDNTGMHQSSSTQFGVASLAVKIEII